MTDDVGKLKIDYQYFVVHQLIVPSNVFLHTPFQ